MRFGGLAVSLLWLSLVPAIAGESQLLQRSIAVAVRSGQPLSLMPGALGTLSLKSPAYSLTVKDSTVASGYISSDTVAIITARSPGRTTVNIKDQRGDIVESIELDVKRASTGPASTAMTGPGPTFSHTPDRHDLLSLMGPRFSLDVPAKANRAAMPAAVEALVDGERARPPIGWHQFCGFYPEECNIPDLVAEPAILSPQRWQQLLAINVAVNHRIKPLSDADHHGIVEHWDYPMDGFGDCEDYALLKRRLLIESGWPRSSVLMTVVRDQDGDGHAILTVATDRGDLVLDNQINDVLPWIATGYRFVKRQSGENPNVWMSLKNVDSAIVAFSGSAPR